MDLRVLECLALLESRTAELYSSFSQRTSNPETRGILDFIAEDSLKHARLFRNLLRESHPNARVGEEDCRRMLGSFYMEALASVERLLREAGSPGLGEEEVYRLLKQHEDSVGEEYLVGLVASLASTLPEKTGRRLRKLLELVGEDEKRHSSLVKRLLETPRQGQG